MWSPFRSARLLRPWRACDITTSSSAPACRMLVSRTSTAGPVQPWSAFLFETFLLLLLVCRSVASFFTLSRCICAMALGVTARIPGE